MALTLQGDRDAELTSQLTHLAQSFSTPLEFIVRTLLVRLHNVESMLGIDDGSSGNSNIAGSPYKGRRGLQDRMSELEVKLRILTHNIQGFDAEETSLAAVAPLRRVSTVGVLPVNNPAPSVKQSKPKPKPAPATVAVVSASASTPAALPTPTRPESTSVVALPLAPAAAPPAAPAPAPSDANAPVAGPVQVAGAPVSTTLTGASALTLRPSPPATPSLSVATAASTDPAPVFSLPAAESDLAVTGLEAELALVRAEVAAQAADVKHLQEEIEARTQAQIAALERRLSQSNPPPPPLLVPSHDEEQMVALAPTSRAVTPRSVAGSRLSTPKSARATATVPSSQPSMPLSGAPQRSVPAYRVNSDARRRWNRALARVRMFLAFRPKDMSAAKLHKTRTVGVRLEKLEEVLALKTAQLEKLVSRLDALEHTNSPFIRGKATTLPEVAHDLDLLTAAVRRNRDELERRMDASVSKIAEEVIPWTAAAKTSLSQLNTQIIGLRGDAHSLKATVDQQSTQLHEMRQMIGALRAALDQERIAREAAVKALEDSVRDLRSSARGTAPASTITDAERVLEIERIAAAVAANVVAAASQAAEKSRAAEAAKAAEVEASRTRSELYKLSQATKDSIAGIDERVANLLKEVKMIKTGGHAQVTWDDVVYAIQESLADKVSRSELAAKADVTYVDDLMLAFGNKLRKVEGDSDAAQALSALRRELDMRTAEMADRRYVGELFSKLEETMENFANRQDFAAHMNLLKMMINSRVQKEDLDSAVAIIRSQMASLESGMPPVVQGELRKLGKALSQKADKTDLIGLSMPAPEDRQVLFSTVRCLSCNQPRLLEVSKPDEEPASRRQPLLRHSATAPDRVNVTVTEHAVGLNRETFGSFPAGAPDFGTETPPRRLSHDSMAAEHGSEIPMPITHAPPILPPAALTVTPHPNMPLASRHLRGKMLASPIHGRLLGAPSGSTMGPYREAEFGDGSRASSAVPGSRAHSRSGSERVRTAGMQANALKLPQKGFPLARP